MTLDRDRDEQLLLDELYEIGEVHAHQVSALSVELENVEMARLHAEQALETLRATTKDEMDFCICEIVKL